jgi:dUTP pyrophosphatase
MIISKHEKAVWEEVSELNESERGAGGFGSTGHK